MPAKTTLPSPLSKFARTKKLLYALALVAIAALGAWVHSALAATSATSTSAITPALKLAAGTIQLEGTGQAVDAASAARLLPLWQLLAQLDTSGSAASEEITAVIDEIELTMTPAQIKAISSMSLSNAELGLPSGNAGTSTKATSTQVASAASDPMLSGGMAAGGPPMDGGAPMPSGSTQGTASSKTSTSSSTSAAPAVIRQVIQLLQSKIQS